MQPESRYKKGDKIGGRYLVHQTLMGGMGEVYLCLDLEQNLPLALKTFQARYLTNQKLRQLFESEVAIWVALENHPNIVRCYYMVTVDHHPFMFLEWIASDESHGSDLRSWLARGPLDFRLALDFAIDICRGLIHAGQKQPGLVHRDLKPENVLVAQGRVAKITDFGLAKIVQDATLALPDLMGDSSGRRHLSSMGGTPPYMAPEQWRGEELDSRTDIYALGCMLFEMLTGHLPFSARTLDHLRTQHLEGGIPALSTAESFPAVLNPLLEGCLAKQREKRFASMDTLLQELDGIYQREFGRAPRATPIGQDFTAVDYNNRGLTYRALGRHAEALADYEQALRIDPGIAHAYNNRGLCHHDLGQHDDALADYTQALRVDPNDPVPYYNRGNTYRDLERHAEALADYSQALRFDPTDPVAFNNRGLTFHDLGQYDEALVDYAEAIRIDVNLAMAYFNRGTTYGTLQRHEEALADYSHAIQLDPDDPKAYSNRGVIYERLQRYEEALADYTQALRLDPYLVAAYCNRGSAYLELQRYDEALVDYAGAIRMDHDNTAAYHLRGRTYDALGRHEEALADFTQVLRINPNDAAAYRLRGGAHNKLGRHEDALADFTQALRIDPDDAPAYIHCGATHYKLGRHEEALAEFTQALRIDPNNAPAYHGRGLVHNALCRYDEALADYNQSLCLDSENGGTHLSIGALLANHGALREALPYFEEAARLGDSTAAGYAAQIRGKLEVDSD